MTSRTVLYWIAFMAEVDKPRRGQWGCVTPAAYPGIISNCWATKELRIFTIVQVPIENHDRGLSLHVTCGRSCAVRSAVDWQTGRTDVAFSLPCQAIWPVFPYPAKATGAPGGKHRVNIYMVYHLLIPFQSSYFSDTIGTSILTWYLFSTTY